MAILNQVCDRLLDTGFFITVDIFDALVIQLAVDNYQRNACCLDALDPNIVFRTLTYQKNTIVIGCCNALRKAPFHGIITMIMRPLWRLLEELYSGPFVFHR